MLYAWDAEERLVPLLLINIHLIFSWSFCPWRNIFRPDFCVWIWSHGLFICIPLCFQTGVFFCRFVFELDVTEVSQSNTALHSVTFTQPETITIDHACTDGADTFLAEASVGGQAVRPQSRDWRQRKQSASRFICHPPNPHPLTGATLLTRVMHGAKREHLAVGEGCLSSSAKAVSEATAWHLCVFLCVCVWEQRRCTSPASCRTAQTPTRANHSLDTLTPIRWWCRMNTCLSR